MSRHPLNTVVALTALAALGWTLCFFPWHPVWLAMGLAGYAALLWYRPQAWLAVVPALLPVFDLAPLSGWFFVNELDLLLLATVAVGYYRADRRVQARWPHLLLFTFGLFTLTYVLATVIGLQPLDDIDVNAFSNYNSNYNALREFKGLAWVLVLLPLLRRTAGPDLANLRTWFLPGMLAGLGLACLAVMYERFLFPGLLNFGAEYRPTGSFSAMHTGGAALDAYLALTFPLVALWLFGRGSRTRHVLGFILLMAGCYAGFTTFSRDVFLAYGASAMVIALLLGLHRMRVGQLRIVGVVGMAAVLALVAYALVHLFAVGGYRGLAAALLLLLATVVLSTLRGQRHHGAQALALTLAGAALATGLSFATAKGPYLAAGVGSVAFLVGAALARRAPGRAAGALLCHAAFGALLASAITVPRYWGGPDGLLPGAAVALLALALVAANRLPREPLWTLNRGTLTAGLLAAIVLATTIPIAGSYYLGSRFATVGDDISTRVQHWREALSMMDDNIGPVLFGMGLGRYPETYALKNMHGEMPGSYRFDLEQYRNQYLRMVIPQYPLGYGEMLRFLQRVDAPPGRTYVFSVDLKRTLDDVTFSAALCERWLIYPQNCRSTPIRLMPANRKWQHYEVEIKGGSAPTLPAFLRAPVQLQFTADGNGARIDVDNVSLVDKATQTELLRNGSFSDANDYWFISSDHAHMPYHVKNFAVNTVFSTGWVGFGVTVLLLLYVAGSLVGRGLNGELEGAVYLACVTGFMIVGLFDSLFDVPRLTLAFFLLLLAAYAQPVPQGRSRKRVRRPSSGRRLDYGEKVPAEPAAPPAALQLEAGQAS